YRTTSARSCMTGATLVTSSGYLTRSSRTRRCSDPLTHRCAPICPCLRDPDTKKLTLCQTSKPPSVSRTVGGMTVLPDLPNIEVVRQTLGRSLFGMVAGPDGPANRARIHKTPGPRWFREDRPIRRVHADASMFVGGLRALLLQSLHPLAMAGG